MQKMHPEYATKLLNGGYAFGNRFHSKTDDMLIVQYEEDEWPYTEYYCGTELNNGQLQVDEKGYVSFRRVKPVIDENTKFTF